MSDLENSNTLGPLVFHEIHKLLTDSDYREAFTNFHVLNQIKTVIFGLTASLPPSLYVDFCKLTQMTWKVMRTPSWRKELKYDVVGVTEDKDINPASYISAS